MGEIISTVFLIEENITPPFCISSMKDYQFNILNQLINWLYRCLFYSMKTDNCDLFPVILKEHIFVIGIQPQPYNPFIVDWLGANGNDYKSHSISYSMLLLITNN